MIAETKWRTTKLGDVAKVISGFAFKSQDFQGSGVPVIKIKNIRIGTIDLSEAECVDYGFLTLDKKFHVTKGDLLISLTGSHLSQPNSVVGRVALSQFSETFLLNQRAGKVIIRDDKICSQQFLFYALFGQEKRHQIALMASGAASQANISPSQVESIEIMLPQLSMQYRIVDILSAYDRLIENNTRRIKILESIAQLLYREWFVNFRFPGYEEVKLVESAIGLIPEGWEVNNIGALLNYHIGGGWGQEEPDEKHVIPAYVIRGTDIPPARTVSLAKCPLRFHTLSNFKSRKINFGDIIFEVSGGSKGQPVGRSLRISQHILKALKENVICASFCKLIRVNEDILKNELLYLLLIEMYDDGRLNKHQVQSTGITNFKFTSFLDNEFTVIPPRDLQDKFSTVLTPIFELTQNLGARNSNLRQTRDLLLPKLISGEIDVEALDLSDLDQGETIAA